jgi:ABC-type ATPase with predicted acetyltransferase domain
LAGFHVLPGNYYRLWRFWNGSRVLVWPLWRKTLRIEKPYYKGIIVAREAEYESDYEHIVSLEQYHYASKEELVAIWKCPRCGTVVEANTRPKCPKCGARMVTTRCL